MAKLFRSSGARRMASMRRAYRSRAGKAARVQSYAGRKYRR